MTEVAGPNDDAPVLPQYCRGKGVTVPVVAVGPVHAFANGAAAGNLTGQESISLGQSSEIKKKSRRQRRQVISSSSVLHQA